MSRAILDEHRAIWARKAALRDVYRTWFALLEDQAPRGGRVLEIGSGPGFLSRDAALRRPDLRWTAVDVLPAPWHHSVADALRLPFRSEAFDTVVGLDVLHHLAKPERFFREAARVLRAGGRLAMVEPWVTPLSYPVYRFLHREGCNLRLDPWDPFPLAPGQVKQAFDGDAAVPFRLLGQTPPERWGRLGFARPEARPLSGFAYLLSLGFQPRSFLPRFAASPLLSLDARLHPLAGFLGMRVFVVWTREGA